MCCKTKKIIYSVTYGTLLCLIILSMILFSMLTPYEDSWGVETKQVNDDALLVLRTYWILISALNIVFCLFSKRHKKWAFVIFLILALLCVAKSISLLLI